MATARTVAVNTLVMFEVFYLLNTRFLSDSTLSWRGLFGSRPVLLAVAIVIALQVLFTHTSFMQTIFDTRPLSAETWFRLVVVASSVYLIVEAEKWFMRRCRIQGRAFSTH